jgi:hypothetical protein
MDLPAANGRVDQPHLAYEACLSVYLEPSSRTDRRDPRRPEGRGRTVARIDDDNMGPIRRIGAEWAHGHGLADSTKKDSGRAAGKES